jgi:hypothetical protein
MNDEDDDNRSKPPQHSNDGTSARRQPPLHTNQPNQALDRQNPRRARPARPQNQQQRGVAEASAPTSSSSNLNPVAPDFVPGQRIVASDAVERVNASSDAAATRHRHRGGRRGKNSHDTKPSDNKSESASTEGPSNPVRNSRPIRKPNRNDNRTSNKPAVSKESDDLMQRMTDSLSRGEYDCSICTDKVIPAVNSY